MRDRRSRKPRISKNNADIREELYERDILIAELGEELGMERYEISRMLTYELTPEDKQTLRDAMKRIEDARVGIKTSAAKVEACDAQGDEGNHQDDYSMDDAIKKLLNAVLMHNNIPAKKFEYSFEYNPCIPSVDCRNYGVEVKLFRSFDWRYIVWSNENFNDGYEIIRLRDTESVMEAVRMVAHDTEVFG